MCIFDANREECPSFVDYCEIVVMRRTVNGYALLGLKLQFGTFDAVEGGVHYIALRGLINVDEVVI